MSMGLGDRLTTSARLQLMYKHAYCNALQAGDLYRCRKCRRLLLTQRNVLNIDEACLGHRVFRARGAKVARTGPGEGNNQQGMRVALHMLDRNRHLLGLYGLAILCMPAVSLLICWLCACHAESEGSSLFVEPMAWMSDAVVGAVQGKLYCPGCSARLGSFNWSGR
jgi:dual specificity phosphatase 12